MELNKSDIRKTKGLAILFMIILHLFQRLNYQELYTPLFFVCGKPVVYYLGLLSDCCVSIYCFCSGYAQYILYRTHGNSNFKDNFIRVGKLLINYWIIVCSFSLLGSVLNSTERIPGNFKEFISNFFLISKSYNGAWWFVLTYILLMLFSAKINRVVEKYSSILIVSVSGVFFVSTHFLKEGHESFLGNGAIGWLALQMVLLLNSLFPYLLGSVFIKEKIYSKIKNIVKRGANIYTLNFFMILVFVAVTIGHAMVPSSIVAPCTGVIVIIAFNIIESKYIDRIFGFLGKHSTNIWLTHMFFYTEIFDSLVFKAKYPIIILGFILILTILTSYIINSLYYPLINAYQKVINREAG